MLSEWEEHGNGVMHVKRSVHRVQWETDCYSDVYWWGAPGTRPSCSHANSLVVFSGEKLHVMLQGSVSGACLCSGTCPWGQRDRSIVLGGCRLLRGRSVGPG